MEKNTSPNSNAIAEAIAAAGLLPDLDNRDATAFALANAYAILNPGHPLPVTQRECEILIRKAAEDARLCGRGTPAAAHLIRGALAMVLETALELDRYEGLLRLPPVVAPFGSGSSDAAGTASPPTYAASVRSVVSPVILASAPPRTPTPPPRTSSIRINASLPSPRPMVSIPGAFPADPDPPVGHHSPSLLQVQQQQQRPQQWGELRTRAQAALSDHHPPVPPPTRDLGPGMIATSPDRLSVATTTPTPTPTTTTAGLSSSSTRSPPRRVRPASPTFTIPPPPAPTAVIESHTHSHTAVQSAANIQQEIPRGSDDTLVSIPIDSSGGGRSSRSPQERPSSALRLHQHEQERHASVGYGGFPRSALLEGPLIPKHLDPTTTNAPEPSPSSFGEPGSDFDKPQWSVAVPSSRRYQRSSGLPWLTVLLIGVPILMLVTALTLDGGVASLNDNPWIGPMPSVLAKWGAPAVRCMRPSVSGLAVPSDCNAGVGGAPAQHWRWLLGTVGIPLGIAQAVVAAAMLARFGAALEISFGPSRMLLVYLIGGIAGLLASALVHPTQLQSGPWTPSLALYSACMVDDLAHWHAATHPWRDAGRYVFGLALILAISFLFPIMDPVAVLAALVAGVLAAASVRPPTHMVLLARSRTNGPETTVLVSLSSQVSRHGSDHHEANRQHDLARRWRACGAASDTIVRFTAAAVLIGVLAVGMAVFYNFVNVRGVAEAVPCGACRYLSLSTWPFN